MPTSGQTSENMGVLGVMTLASDCCPLQLHDQHHLFNSCKSRPEAVKALHRAWCFSCACIKRVSSTYQEPQVWACLPLTDWQKYTSSLWQTTWYGCVWWQQLSVQKHFTALSGWPALLFYFKGNNLRPWLALSYLESHWTEVVWFHAHNHYVAPHAIGFWGLK